MLDVNDINGSEKSQAEQLGVSEKVEAGKYRRWMLTIKAADHSQEEIIEKLSRYKGFAGQLEEGKKKKGGSSQGYLHYQVYVEHSNAIRFETLKKLFPTAHLEVARSDAATCVAYCTKDDETRRGEPFEGGTIDLEGYQGKRNDLEEMRQRLIDGERYEELVMKDVRALRNMASLQKMQVIVDQQNIPRKRDVKAHYLHGSTGLGKSYSVWEKHDWDLQRLYAISEYKHGCWDHYSAHEAVLLDEFRGQWSIGFMLRLLDIYPMRLPARFMDRVAGFETVYVLSNIPFDEQYQDVDEKTRQAFRRRFDSIGEMMEDGTIVYEKLDGEEVVRELRG